MTFFLSTPKSGTNLITGCLSALTRKPISWLYWGNSILDPLSPHRQHLSYNRLKLTLISDIPLLYRTHYQFNELMQIPSEFNKLIFVTRNPKELIYRKFLLQSSSSENSDFDFIESYLKQYIKPFEVYEAWHPDHRQIVFYEDFILHMDEIALQLLQFMEKPPLFLEDFLTHKEEYLFQLLQSYSHQHRHNLGGSSSKDYPKAIHYTKHGSKKTLEAIDHYLQTHAPQIWNKYLKRYETVE